MDRGSILSVSPFLALNGSIAYQYVQINRSGGSFFARLFSLYHWEMDGRGTGKALFYVASLGRIRYT